MKSRKSFKDFYEIKMGTFSHLLTTMKYNNDIKRYCNLHLGGCKPVPVRHLPLLAITH